MQVGHICRVPGLEMEAVEKLDSEESRRRDERQIVTSGENVPGKRTA